MHSPHKHVSTTCEAVARRRAAWLQAQANITRTLRGGKGIGDQFLSKFRRGEGVRECLPEDVRSKLRPEAHRRVGGVSSEEAHQARWTALERSRAQRIRA